MDYSNQIEYILNLHYDEATLKFIPIHFISFDHSEVVKDVIYQVDLKSDFENIEKPLQERFPQDKVDEFRKEISEKYNKA